MKQRLVGTLVLGSLALILIPLLLDGEGVERAPLSGSIPPAPVFDTTPLPEPERPVILADSLVPATATTGPEAAVAALPETADVPPADAVAATESSPVPPPAETAVVAAVAPPEPAAQSISEPALDAAGLPEGWVVRVGVFGEKANAERLSARLTADAYKAFIRPVGVSSGVFIGPVATQNEATVIQRQLNGAKAKYQIGDASVQRLDIGQ